MVDFCPQSSHLCRCCRIIPHPHADSVRRKLYKKRRCRTVYGLKCYPQIVPQIGLISKSLVIIWSGNAFSGIYVYVHVLTQPVSQCKIQITQEGVNCSILFFILHIPISGIMILLISQNRYDVGICRHKHSHLSAFPAAPDLSWYHSPVRFLIELSSAVRILFAFKIVKIAENAIGAVPCCYYQNSETLWLELL